MPQEVTNQKLVSIIIPCYNGEEFIEQTIQSVLTQTYIHWELLIIDDGSTDKSSVGIKKYLNDSRIQYYYKNNGGVSSARNVGLKLAKGCYIAFLDADDIWESINLEEKINALNQHEQADWVFSDMSEFLETLHHKTHIKGSNENMLNNYLLQNSLPVPGICSNIIVRKKCIESGIQYDENLSTAADQDFVMTLLLNHKPYYIPKSLWNYRVTNASMSKNVAAIEHDHIYLLNKLAKMKLYKSFRFKMRCSSNTHLILAGCYWNNLRNKKRVLIHLFYALFYNPLSIKQIISKIY
ncbi:MAG: glycosyltransferase [Bacteroidia bacterium]